MQIIEMKTGVELTDLITFIRAILVNGLSLELATQLDMTLQLLLLKAISLEILIITGLS